MNDNTPPETPSVAGVGRRKTRLLAAAGIVAIVLAALLGWIAVLGWLAAKLVASLVP